MELFKETINDLIAAPEYQDEKNGPLLRGQITRFPYCQSLRLALARHCNVFKLADADVQVNLAAIFAPDRVVLFNLISMEAIPGSLRPVDVIHQPDSDQTVEEHSQTEEAPVETGRAESETALAEESPAGNVVSESVQPQADLPPVEVTQSVMVQQEPEIPGNQLLTEELIEEHHLNLPESVLSEPALPVQQEKHSEQQHRAVAEEISRAAARKAQLERELADEVPVRKTFLYWLKKTQRGYFLNSKNGADIIPADTQSITAVETPRLAEADPLEKNYQANLFQLKPLDFSESVLPAGSVSAKKEDQLIQNFLSEDPQHIKPNQLVEDDDSVEQLVERASMDAGIVTETLAAIYYQQKQYDKALKAYDDLRLKFPNKSAYFAGLHEKIKNEVAGSK